MPSFLKWQECARVIPHHVVTNELGENIYLDALFHETCEPKYRFLKQCQLFFCPVAPLKVNNDVIWRFMTSKYTVRGTPR